MKATTQQYPANPKPIIRYTVKYRKHLLIVILNSILVITLTLKLDVKYFIFVLITKPMIFYAQMVQFSIKNILYVFGGISSIVTQQRPYIPSTLIYMIIR